MIFDRHPEYRDKYGRHFGARGYYAETKEPLLFTYKPCISVFSFFFLHFVVFGGFASI